MNDRVTSGSADLLSEEAIVDPHAFYGRLREEDPIHWNEPARSWVLTRYDDVSLAFTEERLSSDRVTPVFETKLSSQEQEERGGTFEVLADWMVFNDPPKHTRLRGLAQSAFRPRTVRELVPRIGEIVEHVLRDLPESGEIDLVRQVAYPIPAMVIAEMLGVPVSDRDKFKAWSDSVSVLIFGGAHGSGDRAAAQDGLLSLRDYLRALVEHYREEPGDNLLTDMLRAQVDDDSLTEDELVHTSILLLFGGHETTTNLIANSLLALISNPDQQEILLADREDATAAVEELNRFDGPSRMVVRRAVSTFDFQGTTINAGDRVYLCQAAANRDPRRFEDPDRLDLRREDTRHVSFGYGIHYCLGSNLARLEAQMVLVRLLERLPDARLTETAPEWLPLIVVRGMRSMPIRFGT